MLANTFRYRLGPMVLLAALFIAKDVPGIRVFGLAICVWIVFEALIKLYIDARRK